MGTRNLMIGLIALLHIVLFSCRNKEGNLSDSGNPKTLLEDVKKNDQQKGDNLLPFKEGIIHYRYTGSYEGTQIIYFKENGKIFRVEEDYINRSSPVGERVHQVYINTPERTVYINLNDKIGYEILQTEDSKVRDNLLKDITEQGLDSAMFMQGYSKTTDKEIAGKICRVYVSKGGESQFCFWNNINIKTDMVLGEKFKYSLEATKIEDNIKVSDDKFDVPKDVKIMPYKEYEKKAYKF